MTRRKANQPTSKPGSVVDLGRVQTKPVYGLDGVRRGGGVNRSQASLGNVGTCRPDAKGEFQSGRPREKESTNAGHRGGAARSSEEVAERSQSKGAASFKPEQGPTRRGEELLCKGKAFEIPKALVWAAYQDVKRAKGGPGVDEQTMEDFDEHRNNLLYKIWNRLSSGSYMPPPVLRVEIPKSGGGVRELGIPTISDRIAQATIKRYLEPFVEPHFHEDSYGYRPGRSALDAVAQARVRCWRDDWVLDLDLSRFFDTLNHDLVMRGVRRFTECRWVLLYVKRWLEAEVQLSDGTRQSRTQGTPQGGVISPLLANIFLHLAFDQWMKECFPHIHFERYADDIVVHCRSKKQLDMVRARIERRLVQCKLELNEQKTRVVYCKDSKRVGTWDCQSFDFLGYTFRPRSARGRDGKFFVTFSPAISRNAAKVLRQEIHRNWRLRSKAHLTIDSVARIYNPVIQGWINYYGKFRPSELHSVLNHINLALVRWAMGKFKKLEGHKTRTHEWLKRVARRQPRLFRHWRYQSWMTRAV